jgi:hypothetical protein
MDNFSSPLSPSFLPSIQYASNQYEYSLQSLSQESLPLSPSMLPDVIVDIFNNNTENKPLLNSNILLIEYYVDIQNQIIVESDNNKIEEQNCSNIGSFSQSNQILQENINIYENENEKDDIIHKIVNVTLLTIVDTIVKQNKQGEHENN